MKKKYIILLIIIILLLVTMITYKVVTENVIRNKTYDYLETKGYTDADISSIEIKHSFLNKLLSYDEWVILIKFNSNPNITFTITYRNKEFLFIDVSSTIMLDKDEILDYEKKFNNGELKK